MNAFLNFFIKARFRLLSHSLVNKVARGKEIPDKFLKRLSALLPLFEEGAKERERSLALLERAKRRNEAIREVRAASSWLCKEDFADHIERIGEEGAGKLEGVLSLMEKEGLSSGSEFLRFRKEAGEALARWRDYLEQKEVYDSLEEVLRGIGSWEGYLSARAGEPFRRKAEGLGKIAARFKKPAFPFPDVPRFEEAVREHNRLYVEERLGDPIFDDVNGLSLDADQRRAALTEEEATIVIAGAGAGKTLTLCGKCRYLIEREGVDPRDILLLSYSRKSAEDLQRKAQGIDPALRATTFHALGLSLLQEAKGKRLAVEEQFEKFAEDYFGGKDNPERARRILEIYACYFPLEESEDGQREEKAILRMKEKRATTLRSAFRKEEGRRTVAGEAVKSEEELALANFYFLNGIDYEYERPYEADLSTPEHRQYCPDFYLPEAKAYHEHYGLNREGRARQYTEDAERRYLDGVLWKEAVHRANGTKCLKTYSYQFKDGTIFDSLMEQLSSLGVRLKPLSGDELKAAQEKVWDSQGFRSFLQVILSFVRLYKSEYKDESGFSSFLSSPKINYRSKKIIALSRDFYLAYRARLKETGKIDFDDMILGAAEALPSLEGHSYSHVIVDESQDISSSRMRLLEALLAKGGGKLFAVGDDWQSIYRFAGSDIGIFLDLGKRFPKAETCFLRATHRSPQELQEIAGNFVMKNPRQIRKDIHAEKSLAAPVKILYANAGKEEALRDALRFLSETLDDPGVLLLVRNNSDIKRYEGELRFARDGRCSSLTFPKMRMRASTVHSAKGLEEDAVILLSGEEGYVGFPNMLEDDPVLSLVLSSPERFPYAEERRLFYVAMTRTKSYFIAIADPRRPSRFVKEIEPFAQILSGEEDSAHSTKVLCPKCKSGRLVLRQKDGREFLGCSNYPYCDYRTSRIKEALAGRRCPECGDFLVARQARNGQWFLGCGNYPRCQHTEPYRPLKNGQNLD